MRFTKFFAASLFFLVPAAFGQWLSVGVKGGLPFTGALNNVTIPSSGELQHTFSNSNNYIVGGMVEAHLPFGFSVEADGLYRPLNFTEDLTVGSRPTVRYQENVSSWEFPVVAKYHFSFPVIKPYVEAGPIFRTTGSQFSYFSNHGFTAGGGVDFKFGHLRIGPEVRYMRWAGDSSTPFLPNVPANPNQAELLLGISF